MKTFALFVSAFFVVVLAVSTAFAAGSTPEIHIVADADNWNTNYIVMIRKLSAQEMSQNMNDFLFGSPSDKELNKCIFSNGLHITKNDLTCTRKYTVRIGVASPPMKILVHTETLLKSNLSPVGMYVYEVIYNDGEYEKTVKVSPRY